MMVGNEFNGIKQVENGLKKGEIIGFAMGIFLFAVSIYAFSLSVKANRLSIRKLKDEGYE